MFWGALAMGGLNLFGSMANANQMASSAARKTEAQLWENQQQRKHDTNTGLGEIGQNIWRHRKQKEMMDHQYNLQQGAAKWFGHTGGDLMGKAQIDMARRKRNFGLEDESIKFRRMGLGEQSIMQAAGYGDPQANMFGPTGSQMSARGMLQSWLNKHRVN
jgi:hypothetical protein